MASKDYTLVAGRWPQVISKPGDAVYLSKEHKRGDVVSLDPHSEDAQRLLGCGAIVEKGKEPVDLKAELEQKAAGSVFASPEAAQASGGRH